MWPTFHKVHVLCTCVKVAFLFTFALVFTFVRCSQTGGDLVHTYAIVFVWCRRQTIADGDGDIRHVIFVPGGQCVKPFCVYMRLAPYQGPVTLGAGNTDRADSRFAPSQWETSLQSNAVSHWLGANLESAMTRKPTRKIFFISLFTAGQDPD